MGWVGRGSGITGRAAPILMMVLPPGGYGISAMRGAGAASGCAGAMAAASAGAGSVGGSDGAGA